MKITKLETFLIQPRWLFLKIHTDGFQRFHIIEWHAVNTLHRQRALFAVAKDHFRHF